MNRFILPLSLLLAVSLVALSQVPIPVQPPSGGTAASSAQRERSQVIVDPNKPVESAQQLANEGLRKDAYDLLRPWLLDSANGDDSQYQQGLQIAVESLQRLNRMPEIDELLESAANAQKASWRGITSIAEQYRSIPSYGFIIDNKFERGQRRGGGQYVQIDERDRVRSLQLLQEVMPLVLEETADGRRQTAADTAQFYQTLAYGLMRRDGGWGWKFQILTDLDVLPDYTDGPYYGGSSGAPVDAEGNPIYYYVPESWETAKNDGERWRWALEQVAKADPEQQKNIWREQADFYQSQFGEQTLSGFNFWQRTEQDTDTTASILNLETLTDDETIAKLANGIKRFELPEEFNYIKLYQKIGDVPALAQLAEIAKNRRQYIKAAAYYSEIIERITADDDNRWRREQSQQQLDQIIGNWGRFEQAGSDVSGLRADLRYVFRNGKNVKLSVQEINVEQLIADIKEYLKSRPNQLDWQQIQIDQVGQRLFYNYGRYENDEEREKARQEINQKYVGKTIKTWEVPLQPAEKHFDRSATIRFEHETAGAFLIRAEMEDGNVESAVIWLHDTAIVRKNLDRASLYFVADAATGQPIAGANVDLFGYFVEHRAMPVQNNQQRQEPTLTWTFQETSQRTDENGFVTIAGNDNRSNRFNTLITAAVPGRKGVAHLGFANLWTNPRYDAEYNAVKTFVMSDRPVYRPLDTVNIKAWVGTAKYDMPNTNEWAGRAVGYEIYNPRNEKIAEKNVVLDEYGGFETELELAKDAMLGQYRFRISSTQTGRLPQMGGGSFRVEEYKTPEYEVIVEAPKEPVSLGEEITATIRANYYFGSPVSEATVKYTVKREKAATDWYPIRPWDWFYGSGYSWFAYDAEWLPGWSRWGIRRPSPPWFPRYSGPPEVVAEAEVLIKPDGTVDVVIDTAIAKEMFPNDSQRYTITAEVVDNSRRTIVGTGTVLVAKEPYKIYAWVDRGFYVPEQKIAASFQTRRLDGKPVSGEGVVKVFRVTYVEEAGGRRQEAAEPATVSPVETEIYSAMVVFDTNGKANLDLTAAEAGQYRISCVLDGQEGGYVFNVYSDSAAACRLPPAASQWKYNALELIPEREEFAPGESVTLRVNTNRDNSTVLLFVRPANGVAAGKPQVLRLDGKSTEVSIPVVQRDMPNFFVEALTVSGGKVVNEVKEIVVPPQQRILNVEVRPNAETYKPGGKATADLIVTDLDGKPVVGQIAVTIYDKSVEYISGGSNVGDIKEFFWKWRRNHRPQSMTNLNRFWQRFTELDKPGMDTLGIFGHIGIPEMAMNDGGTYANGMVGGRAGGFGGGNWGGASIGAMGDGLPARRSMVMASEPMDMASAPMAQTPLALPGMEMADASFDESGGGSFIEPAVRTNFADTALWIGALETNEEGVAQIELDMPESLTTWKINVWTMALGTRVGHGTAEVITRKDFIIRMQTPRFLIEKDKVVFSANVHNYLAEEKTAQVSLEIDRRDEVDRRPPGGDVGDSRQESGETVVQNESALPVAEGDATARRSVAYLIDGEQTQTVKIPANGEVRVDWLVEAKTAGDAIITMKALTDEESDAMQKTLPVYVHGMLKQDSYSAFIAPTETSASFDIRVPEERKPEQTKLTVQFSPSLASSMIDALPYLVDYPYGCTEQTLNRFLPTVIVRKVIGDGWEINEDIHRARGVSQGVESNFPGLRHGLRKPPVFDREQIDEMVRDGVTRLVNMQVSDGGWGWFSGWGERSSPHLTALVVRGLMLAKSCDVAVPDDVLRRGVDWLKRYQDSQIVLLKNAAIPDRREKGLRWKEQADEVDAFVFMVLAETASLAAPPAERVAIDAPTADMMEFLQRDRGKLSLYAVAMVGIAESLLPGEQDITPYVKILEQYLVQDDANQTAYLNLRGNAGWRWWAWYGSEFETQAYYLRLLMRADPKSPIAPRLVKYLLNNRKHATYWNSTRDTAIVIEAFAEYLEATGEGKPNMTVEVLVNGEVKKTVEFTPENFLLVDNALVLEADEVATGTHKVELRVIRHPRPQWGSVLFEPLYITAFLENFTLEDPIEKAGLEVNIERRIYKLVRDESATATVAGNRGQAVDLRVEKYNRVPLIPAPLPDDGVHIGAIFPLVQSGDLIEIELIIESRNDYESLIIEDWKAAGLEPVDLRSGYNGNELGAFVEFRDERVVFFVYRLARGKHSLTYRLRAEIPGEFSALPARIEAMYAPELKGNSDEDKVKVEDRPAAPVSEEVARRIAIKKFDEVQGVDAHLRYNITVREFPDRFPDREDWTVFFKGKVPLPGNHALVWVNKTTGAARFMAGQ